MTRTEHDWPGRYFEDFEEGVTYEHAGGRTIDATDNAWFTLLTKNTNELHYNSEYAKDGLHGRRLVNSCLTLSVVTGLSVAGVSRNAAANLGWDAVELPAPVFEGDTIGCRSTVLSLGESRSRLTPGILKVRTEGYKQDDTIVMTFERTILVFKRGTNPAGAR
jgi:itaconyl-CoA hydratase